jgi:hypothetical protein
MLDNQLWVCPSCNREERQPKHITEVGHSCGKPKQRWHYFQKITQENEKAGATK